MILSRPKLQDADALSCRRFLPPSSSSILLPFAPISCFFSSCPWLLDALFLVVLCLILFSSLPFQREKERKKRERAIYARPHTNKGIQTNHRQTAQQTTAPPTWKAENIIGIGGTMAYHILSGRDGNPWCPLSLDPSAFLSFFDGALRFFKLT